jgi:hypothetical protein
MCNLCSQTKGQQAIIAAAMAMVDRTGNLPPFPGIYPDMAHPSPIRAEGQKDRSRCHQHPQWRFSLLAATAWAGQPVPRAFHKLL